MEVISVWANPSFAPIAWSTYLWIILSWLLEYALSVYETRTEGWGEGSGVDL